MTTTFVPPTTGRSPAELTGEYVFDVGHTRLGFVARHAMITKVRGSFDDFDGRAHLDFADPTRSTVEVHVRTASVQTRNEARDNHLRSSDFFAARDYPEMRFVGRRIRPAGDDWELTGDLTIKGITRPVTFTVSYTGSAVDDDGNLRAGFEATTTVNRQDWGMTWNAAIEAGGVLVSDKVTLEIEVSAIKVDGTG